MRRAHLELSDLGRGAPQVAQWEKNLQWRRHGFDSWVRKDPLEEGMAAHSSILACRIPQSEEPGGLQSMGSQRVDCESKL